MTNRSLLAAIVGLAGTCAAASAQAPLNLVSVNPDVASGFITISYNASSHVFTASGFTQNVNQPPTVPAGNRTFSLTANINNDGTLKDNVGSLIVRGDVGGTDQLLFSGTFISAFGYNFGNIFEFLVTQSAGSLAPIGSSVGTILIGDGLSFPNNNLPSFTSSFNVSFTGRANTFVPTPGAAALLGLGGLVAARRRRA